MRPLIYSLAVMAFVILNGRFPAFANIPGGNFGFANIMKQFWPQVYH